MSAIEAAILNDGPGPQGGERAYLPCGLSFTKAFNRFLVLFTKALNQPLDARETAEMFQLSRELRALTKGVL